VGWAFTDRHGGVTPAPFNSLNLAGDAVGLRANIQRLIAAVGLSQLAWCRQSHSNRVAVIDQAMQLLDLSANPTLALSPGPEVDALVTRQTGVGLLVRVADCVPVILADSAAGVIAVAHAGRVGLLSGVLEATMAAMFGLGAVKLTAWIGPHVCPSCYEVPDQMADAAASILPASRACSRSGTKAIDLGAGVAAVLGEHDVVVHRHDPCTCCGGKTDFYSYRRDGAASGRQGALVWMEPIAAG
jgi:YfiH family protein